MLVEFSRTCIFHHMWETFFHVWWTFLENALNLCIFTDAPVPHSKLQVEFYKNLFPPRRKGWRKLWLGLALSKFNQKIWRWLETLVYLYFVWFVIFPLLCNHGNLTQKLYQKNSYLNEGWHFIGRSKVGNLPRMINKGVLSQFMYKPT